ncbi:MAG: DNA/RNA non-specific endonuclease [Synechococcales cyanobacterium CRU_2_2]|nr:DNA/RNA non-specific endonuclease [Synechococcales cyanobacterium CRU_2_2]
MRLLALLPFWRSVILSRLFLLGMGCLLLTGCGMVVELVERVDRSLSGSPHLLMGNPSDATTTLSQPNNYLMTKSQFALSYNRDRGIPNWVSWQLNQAWLGTISRQNDFRPDPTLPKDWPVITSADYRDKRYDRGHMTPSADRSRSMEDNSATFILTNVLPQASGNNRGPWSALEQYCRNLVSQGNELYIIAGHVGQKERIGRAQLTVPSSVWKVVMVLPQPDMQPGEVSASIRVIAVNMPNVSSIAQQPWQRFVTTVDEIEDLTGYDLLSKVSVGVQRVLEAQMDLRSRSELQRLTP